MMRPPKLRPRIRRVMLDDEQEGDKQMKYSQEAAEASGSGTVPGSASEVEEKRDKKAGRPKKKRTRAVDPEEAERKIYGGNWSRTRTFE